MEYGFTKKQAEVIGLKLPLLIGWAEFVDAKWVALKYFKFPMEIKINKLRDINIYESDKKPGVYAFNIETENGIASMPDNWKDIKIDADRYTIHFKYTEGESIKYYRSFTALPDKEADNGKHYSNNLQNRFKTAQQEWIKLE